MREAAQVHRSLLPARTGTSNRPRLLVTGGDPRPRAVFAYTSNHFSDDVASFMTPMVAHPLAQSRTAPP